MQNLPTNFQVKVIRPVECFKEGWELIKADYFLLFAITLLGAMIGGISLYILIGAMVCGIYGCYLRKIDGKPVSLDDLWKGFAYFVPSLLVTILIVVPLIVMVGILYFPLIAAMVLGSKLSPDELLSLFLGSLAIDIIVSIVMVCFHTLLLFSFLLIVDRKLSGFQAVLTSAKAVWGNLGGVAGIFGVGFVLALIGAMACGVGIYFVIPIIFAGYTVAYRKIFPAL